MKTAGSLLTRISRRIAHPFSRMERVYEDHDPWKMAGELEQYRFRETNRILKEVVGHVPSLIEFGSGEGHQTEYLLEVADSVTGVEKSGLAVERARKRIPSASFIKGELGKFYGHYSVAAAFEVLVYIKFARRLPGRVHSVLETLGRSGDIVFVSCYGHKGQPFWIEPHLPANAARKIIEAPKEFSAPNKSDAQWLVAWWDSPHVPS